MTGRVMVAGLGPAGSELITAGTLAAIDSAGQVRLRTSRHPAAADFEFDSYDEIYEHGDSFDEVYDAIVEDLVGLSATTDVLYLVPGSPRVGESTVERLLADRRVECSVLPAMSFLDLVWIRLGVDPVEQGVRIVDGHRFLTAVAGHSGPFLVAQCSDREVLSDVKLALDGLSTSATLLHHLGLPDERIETVAWSEIDRTLDADHLTSMFIPRVRVPVASELVRLDDLVHRRRLECSWDRRQTHRSLTPALTKVSAETAQALNCLDQTADGERDAAYAEAEQRLGDLLFQIVFQSVLASESGYFTLADVAGSIHDRVLASGPDIDVSPARNPKGPA